MSSLQMSIMAQAPSDYYAPMRVLSSYCLSFLTRDIIVPVMLS
jgi:hypothetical protein